MDGASVSRTPYYIYSALLLSQSTACTSVRISIRCVSSAGPLPPPMSPSPKEEAVATVTAPGDTPRNTYKHLPNGPDEAYVPESFTRPPYDAFHSRDGGTILQGKCNAETLPTHVERAWGGPLYNGRDESNHFMPPLPIDGHENPHKRFFTRWVHLLRVNQVHRLPQDQPKVRHPLEIPERLPGEVDLEL